MKFWLLVLLGQQPSTALGRGGSHGHGALRGGVSSLTNAAAQFNLNRTAGTGWYTVELAIDGKPVRVVVDTASPWLWSYGAKDTSAEDAAHFTINYASAAVSGDVVQEALSFVEGAENVAAALPQLIRGSGSPAVSDKKQCNVGRATAGDEFWIRQWEKSGVEGVLGLACGSADADKPDGLQVALTCAKSAAGSSTSSTFSLQLRDDGGTLTFGYIPDALRVGLARMPPSLMCGNWRVPVEVRVGGRAGSVKEHTRVEAVLDSAAPGIVGLFEHVTPLAKALGANIDVREGGMMVFVIPCAKADSMPGVTFSLGSQNAVVRVELAGEKLVVPDSGDQCRLVFGGWDSPQWLLGMPFFRSIRGVVFDTDSRTVSIAP